MLVPPRCLSRTRLGFIFVVSILLAFTSASLAQSNSNANASASAHALNSKLLWDLQVWQKATGSSRSGALQVLEQEAAQRAAQIASLVQTDPELLLAAALPSDVRNSMPPEVQNLIEQRVQLIGQMEVSIEDGQNYSKIHYGLLVAGRRLALHFADHAPNDLITGMEIQIAGVLVGEQLVTSSSRISTNNTNTNTSILPNSFGQQKTIAILVNFEDEVLQPVTVSYVQGLLFSNPYSVSNYWVENSFGQTSAVGDVAGWFTIPVSYTTCNTSSIASYADQAATAAGYNLSNYRHKMYIFPNNACSWWGYSTIGGNPSQSWIRDYNNASSGVAVMNLAHELGHSLGLYHSHGWNCSAYPSTGCSSNEYGDTLDFMGNLDYVTGGDYNAFQRERLGWMNYGAQPPITTVSANGTYDIGPYEAQDGTAKALKIPQANGAYYYVEFRQAQGFDSFLSGNSNVLGGVVVHLATPGSSNSSQLLNMQSSSTESLQPALVTGQTYTDSTAGVSISPVSVSSSGASVQVTFSSAPTSNCTQANPAVSAIGPTGSVSPGATANFTVSLTNNNSSACSSSTYNLTSSVPSGWSTAYSSSVVTLAPGASTSVSLAVTSPTSTSNGTYTITATATDSTATNYSGSASATETVYQPVPTAVSVTTNAASYTANQTVYVNVSVLSGTLPLAGAGVNVLITKTDGSKVALSGTTTSNGIATVKYRVNKKDPKGVWQVLASSNGTSAGTSFTVQ